MKKNKNLYFSYNAYFLYQLKKNTLILTLLSSKTDCHSQESKNSKTFKKKSMKTIENCRESYKKDKYVSTFFFFLRDQLKLPSILAFPEFSPFPSKTVDWTSSLAASLLRCRGSSHEFSNASAASK